MADGCPADKNKAKGKAETEHQIWMGIAPTMIPDRVRLALEQARLSQNLAAVGRARLWHSGNLG